MSIKQDAEPRGRFSVVIPTLNAAKTLHATLESLVPGIDSGLVGEVLIADGGSMDPTWKIALEFGAGGVNAATGRGAQLAAGAKAAACPWLMFLHADTVLEPGWESEAERFVSDTANRVRAAVFRFAVNDPSDEARRLERVVRWRNRVLHLPYGDQGLLINREFYRHIGGIRPLPLMEDVDLVRRLGRRRLAFFKAAATTSAGRFRADGYLRRSTRNLFCLALYFLHVPPRLIARIYYG